MEGISATRDGKTVAREFGRGVGPALKLLDAGLLVGSEVCDHIVGRAAAAIFVVGGVVRVHADVMSEGAARLLAGHGVPASSDVVTDEIVNRQGTGSCPMEAAVAALSEPRQMVEAIRTKLAR